MKNFAVRVSFCEMFLDKTSYSRSCRIKDERRSGFKLLLKADSFFDVTAFLPYFFINAISLEFILYCENSILGKIVLTYFEKKCSSDRERLFKFSAFSLKFSKNLRSPEHFLRTVKD